VNVAVREDTQDHDDDDDDDEDSTFPDILPPKQSFSFSTPSQQQQQRAKKRGEPQVQIDNDAIQSLIDSLDDGHDAKNLSGNKSRFASLYQGIQQAKTTTDHDSEAESEAGDNDGVAVVDDVDNGGAQNIVSADTKAETKAEAETNSFSRLLDSIDSPIAASNGVATKSDQSIEDDNFSFLSILEDSDNKTKRKPHVRPAHNTPNKAKAKAKAADSTIGSLDEWKDLSKALLGKDRKQIERDDVGDDLLKDLFGDEHAAADTKTETETPKANKEAARKQENTSATARATKLMESIPELMQELNCNELDTEQNDDNDDGEEQWPWQQQQEKQA